ncbi:MAG: phospholipase [Myxococcales bacterium]|nr:phospholipase [Myxococcales bacterium]
MKECELGGLRARVTGGSDREGGGDGPVVVLLHGFGAPGDDLVSLWRVLDVPRGTRFVFPEAPVELEEYGYGARAWWRLDVAALEQAARSGQRPDRSNEVPEGLLSAHGRVLSLLDAVEAEFGVGAERIVLGGFSQGAMLSCDVALRSERPLAGVALLSSTLLARAQWQAGLAERTALAFFQSHGRQDPLLPFAAAERLRDMLREAGCEVSWVEFNGGHEIPMSVLQGLGEFLHARL